MAEMEEKRISTNQVNIGLVEIIVGPPIKLGMYQCRYDAAKKVHKGLRPDCTASENQSAFYQESTKINNFALTINSKMLKDHKFKSINNAHSLAIFRNDTIRETRHEQAHGQAHLHFAMAVLYGTQQNNERCKEIKRDWEDVFQFAYGLTWAEAAAELKPGVGF